MTVVGYRKEAAARSESGNAKHLKRLEPDVSVGPADIGSRHTALAAENSASDGQDDEGAFVPIQVLENFSDWAFQEPG
jgi:hypothetical protein